MALLPVLPSGYVKAEIDHLFTEGENPQLRLGVTFYRKVGDMYRLGQTSEMLRAWQFKRDVENGEIYINPDDFKI